MSVEFVNVVVCLVEGEVGEGDGLPGCRLEGGKQLVRDLGVASAAVGDGFEEGGEGLWGFGGVQRGVTLVEEGLDLLVERDTFGGLEGCRAGQVVV